MVRVHTESGTYFVSDALKDFIMDAQRRGGFFCVKDGRFVPCPMIIFVDEVKKNDS